MEDLFFEQLDITTRGRHHRFTQEECESIGLEDPIVKSDADVSTIEEVPEIGNTCIAELIADDVINNAIFADELKCVWTTSLVVSTLKNDDEIVFCSHLNQWIYRENEEEFNNFKSLKMEILRKNFGWKRIDQIIAKLTKQNVIESNDSYLVGEYSKGYRLTEKFRKSKQVQYTVKTPKMVKLLQNRFWTKLSSVNSNPIARMMMNSYCDIQLPTEEQILDEAKRLIAEGFVTNKGKKLTFLNKLSMTNPRFEGKQLAFVEEDIKLWKRLTSHGLMIPIVSDNAGGRVYDSFNLAPSWIRKLLTIDNQRLTEFDFSCSSPSIALSIKELCGSIDFLTHQKVADSIGSDVKTVKVEHLKYFNCSVWSQMQLGVDSFYKQFDPLFRSKLIQLKKSIGNANVAKMMFVKEVKIMTDIVKNLTQSFVYAFDAIYIKNVDGIEEMINNVLLKNNVRTTC